MIFIRERRTTLSCASHDFEESNLKRGLNGKAVCAASLVIECVLGILAWRDPTSYMLSRCAMTGPVALVNEEPYIKHRKSSTYFIRARFY